VHQRAAASGDDLSAQPDKLSGPDLTTGVALSEVGDGAMLLGHVHGEPAVLARRGPELFAIGAVCTHYGAPLSDGLVVGDTLRCPWHHACFSLRTGEPLRAPALRPVACWQVEVRDGRAYVGTPVKQAIPAASTASAPRPRSIVILGGGGAGNAAAEMLRREGYRGRLTMVSEDKSPPCDRPNLSKGYLAGTASAKSNALRSRQFYRTHDIHLELDARVDAIDVAGRQIQLANGKRHSFDRLLIATGAEPIRLDIPGGNLRHVRYLRTVADSRGLVSRARTAKQVVVLGASFIGLEVAASLRARDISVHVVAPESVPMEKVLGPEVGSLFRTLHESHGVSFHLGTTAHGIEAGSVALKNGVQLPADLVVIGVGVRPRVALAQEAGLAVDRGVTVDEFLETSASGIFAAGDIARWPDRLTGERIRVEHWVVAERQGQTAARNMLGRREPFHSVPFFWTDQYDCSLAYVGHAERWDSVEIDGDLAARNCAITYRKGGKKLAVAVIQRDLQGLKEEAEFERTIDAIR
jgi:NADPH-dependent 2,4-dienoyl-CoA reductase/sulfur reductase-like enzyme/nitrite reductase/ring-hydroxylating ferredoxin subunit